MAELAIHFRGHPCFKTDWSGFESIRPLNIIIGRNNTGKSLLMDLVRDSCHTHPAPGRGATHRHSVLIDEAFVEEVLKHKAARSLPANGSRFATYAPLLIGKRLAWRPESAESERTYDLAEFATILEELSSNWGRGNSEALKAALISVAHQMNSPLCGNLVLSVTAERDITLEQSNSSIQLDPDGRGATNVIRKHLHTTDETYPREQITNSLLSALNKVTAPEMHFTELDVREHDAMSPPHWEVHLGEAGKGLVPLSRSGSGLKTIILVLLNLLVMPRIKDPEVPSDKLCYIFEEIENNLHPAVLRRLLRFIEEHCDQCNCKVFLTTHSSVILDFFAANPRAQVVKVSHNGQTGATLSITSHLDRVDLVAELGAKPSDLMHANGIIWVEGPSDRVYINRFIELFSEGEFREGRDYQCACYGGALLARLQIVSEDEAHRDLVNLFRINTNLLVVCDGDQPRAGAQLKDQVQRIRNEAIEAKGSVWVTGAREIENYLPGTALEAAARRRALPDPGQFAAFWPRKRDNDQSYLTAEMGRRSFEKTELAAVVAPKLTREGLERRFDLPEQVLKIIDLIRSWNAYD